MFEGIKRILGIAPPVDFNGLINDGAIILDVRTKSEFAQGHIRGSVNIPVEKLSSNINKFKSKERPIITCCASGSRSASAKGILSSHGFTNVHNGGAWMRLRQKTNIY